MTPNTPAGGAVAWMAEDGRVVPAETYNREMRNGGASVTAMKPYRVPLVRADATVPLDAVLLIVDKLRNSHINRQAIADELEALTREATK